MTEIPGDPEQQGHAEPAERGRYALYPTPDGGLIIARAAGICQTCVDCGCGEQADPITGPAAVVSMAKLAAEGKMKLPSVKQLRQLAGSRGPGNGRR
jgi:hypothetical protein